MSKRPSLKKQAVDALYSLARFGQSKFEAKRQAIVASKAVGVEGWNPARVEGIYSIETMKTYRKESIAFTQWVKERHDCKWLHDAKRFVEDYLKARIDKGDSAWTLQLTRSALRKLYQEPDLARAVKLPVRHKSQIKRSRGPKSMDKKFSVERNRDLIDFCKATGLRRHELRALRVDHIHRSEDRLWVFVEQGKGGRPRTVPVLRALQDRVLEIVSAKRPEERVFDRIPVRADVHGYRREYANALYQEQAGKAYDLCNKDKDVMLLVSMALGHDRLDIASRSYLEHIA